MNARYTAWVLMSENTFFSQPAFILHQQKYRETSLIIDTLTRDFGRLSLIAKGVRKAKSKTVGILRPFVCLSLSFTGKSNLKTITSADIIGLPFELKGLALYSGFYVNELLCHLLHNDDPHPDVFQAYHECLTQLATTNLYESCLRTFELNLMDTIGYGVNFSYDLQHDKPVNPDKYYVFNKDLGLVENINGQFSGLALLAMAQRQFDEPRVLSEAKQLMRQVIDSHLQGKQLKSRAVINGIIKRL
ncbi:hypothetical protein MCAMS1_00264 [biofilm metagenome]